MNQKLLNALSWLKTNIPAAASSLYAKSPAIAGLCVGYFGHGIIKAGVDIAIGAAKALLKI